MLCFVFHVTSFSFGMENSYQCGTVVCCEKQYSLLENIVNSSFQEEKENGAKFLDELFSEFNQKKSIASEGVNLLFYEGSLYINRFFPIYRAYDEVSVSGKSYDSLQVASVLGLSKIQVISLQMIKSTIPHIGNATSNRLLISAWNSIKSLDNRGKQEKIAILQKNCRSRLRVYYKHLLNFMLAASHLGYNVSDSDFTKETLNAIYLFAEAICKDYIKRIGMYISHFNKEDGDSFVRSLSDKKDVLVSMQQVCSYYRKYAHTEYMLNYHLDHTPHKVDDIKFVSYYDMCNNCEELWAKIASAKQKVGVVSYKSYYDSRNRGRRNCNKYLQLVYR